MPTSPAQTDGGRGEEHGYDLIHQERADEGQYEQPVVEEPIGYSRFAAGLVDLAIL